MADDTTGTPPQAPLDQNIAANLKMADAFYEAAVKGTNQTQKEKDALMALSEIYAKLAKQQADILATKQEIAELDEKARQLLKEQATASETRKKAIDKELVTLREVTAEKTKHRKESEKELEMVKKQVSELGKYKSVLGEMFTSMRAKALAAVISVEALRRGLMTVLQTGRDIADIAILSGKYTGMRETTGVADAAAAFTDAAKQAKEYASAISGAQITLAAFGYTAEEARAAFKDFAQIGKNTEEIEQMTRASGALSRMLGVDLSESTGYMIEQNLKFNKTAAQSAQTLMGVQQSVENMNKGMDKSIIRGRDVTKVLFDISRESKALAQDQDAIAKLLIGNVLQLQKGGVSYKEAFDTSKKFAEILTKDAPEFMQILGGRRIFNELNKNKDAMLGELKKSAPQVAARVEDIMNQVKSKKISQYAAERMINELVGQTKVGLKASMQQFAETMNIGAEGAIERVMASYGVSFTQAKQMIDSAQRGLDLGKVSDKFDELRKDMSKPIPPDQVKALQGTFKEKFDLELDSNTIEALRTMSSEQRENAIQSLMNEKAKKDIVAQQQKDELDKQQQIKDKQAEFARLTQAAQQAQGDTARKLLEEQAGEVKKQIDALQKGPDLLEKMADKLENKYLSVDFKGYAEKILAWFKSPVMQIAAGLASLTVLGAMEAAKFLQAKRQTSLLKQIADNTAGGGGGSNGPKNEIEKGMDLLKKGRGLLSKGAGLIPGIGATLNTGVGTLATSGIGGAATVAGGAAAAGVVGYGIGKYIANPIIDALTTEKNKYGQTSNIVERGFGKLFMSSKEYQDTYGTGQAPVDVGAMNPPPVTGVPGAVGQTGGGPGGGIGFKSEVVPGAGGYDIQLTPFKIGLPAALGANMGLVNKMGARAPGH